MEKKRKILALAGGAVLVLAAAAAGLAFWLASGQLTEAKSGILKSIPFPMALVNNRPIMMEDFLERYESAKVFYQKSGAPEIDDAALKKGVADKMMEEEKLRQLAQKKGVSVKTEEVEEEFAVRAASAAPESNGDFPRLLAEYGLTEQMYKEEVLKPEILSTNLMVWFYGQRSLNQEAYTLAESLIKKINEGSKLEEIAKTFSQDEGSKMTEGDLGFIEISEVLPELKSEVDSMATGQTKLIASRFGLHLINLEERDNNGQQNAARVHLRQIFIKPSSFTDWFGSETKDYKVQKIVKI